MEVQYRVSVGGGALSLVFIVQATAEEVHRVYCKLSALAKPAVTSQNVSRTEEGAYARRRRKAAIHPFGTSILPAKEETGRFSTTACGEQPSAESA